MTLRFISTGVKKHQDNVPLPKADLYLDCRGIPNPHHAAGVQGKGGSDPLLISWVKEKGKEHVENFILQILDSLPQVPLRRRETSDPWASPYTVCCMCAYGVHRSVAMKHILAQHFNGTHYAGQEIKVEVA